METDPPLSLATDDQIVAELKRRSSGLVMARLMPPANGEDPDSPRLDYDWGGGSVLALGLAVHLQRILEQPNSGGDEDDG